MWRKVSLGMNWDIFCVGVWENEKINLGRFSSNIYIIYSYIYITYYLYYRKDQRRFCLNNAKTFENIEDELIHKSCNTWLLRLMIQFGWKKIQYIIDWCCLLLSSTCLLYYLLSMLSDDKGYDIYHTQGTFFLNWKEIIAK